MSWVLEKSFMIFLSLENINKISTYYRTCGDIHDFILSFLLMVGWVGYAELLLIFGIIYLAKAKFGESMFKPNSIQSYTPYLNSYRTFIWSSWIDLLHIEVLENVFFHCLTQERLLLVGLFLSQLCHLKWSQYCCDWNC